MSKKNKVTNGYLPIVAQLRRILELEGSKGYADKAVIGGLEQFLQRWIGSAREAIADSPRRREFQSLFTQVSYATWDKEQRRNWLERALTWLEGNGERSTGLPVSAAHAGNGSPTLVRTQGQSSQRATPPASASLDSPLSSLRGMGPALLARFQKLGVSSVRDLLYFFPHRHLDYSQIKPISALEADKEQTIIATVWEARPVRLGGQMGAEAVLGDETGNIRAVWFNQPYLAKKLSSGARVVLSGRVSIFRGMKQLDSPEWELMEGPPKAGAQSLVHTGRLVPVYPLTQGLSIKRARLLVKEAVDSWAGQMPDFLPPQIREQNHFLALPEAIQQAHYPDSLERKEAARKRLAFDELFLLQLGLLSRKWQWQESLPGPPIPPSPEILNRFLSALPFALTPAQNRALGEIAGDMAQPKPMSRLLQGDVGSGKTVVATAALLLAAARGYQGALMAPTEILAEQHLATLSKLFSAPNCQQEAADEPYTFYPSIEGLPHPLKLALLTGSLRASGKRRMLKLLGEGEIDIIIGTHALIQKGVEFSRLGLTIVDEQHRFGVRQRWELRQKGVNPHMLVMTATPIPRTLALTLYGDLELSVIDQLPPGRPEIKTRWLGPEKREAAYAFLHKQVAAGQQAFIICPLIEESPAIEARAATTEYERLSKTVFPNLQMGLLHGRMGAAAKDEVMREFRNGALQILVSTPVVEVGIDVPNATVILVEGADRFGLSQLHQFRGRVGRGDKASYCILVAESPSPEARERLGIIEKVRDGFLLAEEDLKLRGAGEFFGTRQSGLPELRLARLSDVAMLEMARREARGIFEEDPGLERVEHRPLIEELSRLWRGGGEGS